MRTLVMSLAVIILATAAFTAGYSKVPTQFVGDWSQDNPAEEPGTYRFGLCLPTKTATAKVG